MPEQEELRIILRTIAETAGAQQTREGLRQVRQDLQAHQSATVGATRAHAALGQSFTLSGGQALRFSGALVGVSTAFAAVSAAAGAVGATFRAAIETGIDFSRQMSNVRAVSGATAAQFAALSELARTSGVDLGIGAVEAGRGLGELVKGGVSAEAALGGALRATELLAKAGGVDLATAAEISATAMNSFGLQASQLAHVADLVAGAANASSIGVDDFRQALSQAGAVARTIGTSFDDAAVAIAELGQAGIKGSDAGTSLRTFLLSLNPASQQASDALRQIGVITAESGNRFFDASGKAKGLAEVSQILKTGLAGYSDQQRLATLQTIFGTDAIRAAAVFAREGADGFTKLGTAMSSISAADVARQQVSSLAGDVDKFKASADLAAISLEHLFDPKLRAGAQGLASQLQELDKLLGTLEKGIPAPPKPQLPTPSGQPLTPLAPVTVPLNLRAPLGGTVAAGVPFHLDPVTEALAGIPRVAGAANIETQKFVRSMSVLDETTRVTTFSLVRLGTELGLLQNQMSSVSRIEQSLATGDRAEQAFSAAEADVTRLDAAVTAKLAVAAERQRLLEQTKITDPRDVAGVNAVRERLRLIDELEPRERALIDAREAQNDLQKQAIQLSGQEAAARLRALPANERLEDLQTAQRRAQLIAQDRGRPIDARVAARQQLRQLARAAPGVELAALDAAQAGVGVSRLATRNQLAGQVAGALVARRQEAVDVVVNAPISVNVQIGQDAGFDEDAVKQSVLAHITAAIHQARLEAENAADRRLAGANR